MPRVHFGAGLLAADAVADRVARAATVLADEGIGAGDVVAFMLRNEPAILEVTQAAQRLGAIALPLNWHFGTEEADYILADSGARILVAHTDLLRRLARLKAGCAVVPVSVPPEIAAAFRLSPGDCADFPGVAPWSQRVAEAAPHDAPPQPGGGSLLYTSGTTGRPKGVRRPAPDAAQLPNVAAVLKQVFGTREGQVMLAAAPLYHAAPGASLAAAARVPGDIVILPRFDPEALLAAIQRHRVTHIFMVPVMFSRLLQLPRSLRESYDLSSLEWVMHGAAPCPREIKQAMIDWWGPVIHEYYGASELGPIAACTSTEWLAHPGTVGRAITGAEIAIFDDAGKRLPPGVPGEIYCRQTFYPDFTYHRLGDKRVEVDREGLVTCGDVGMLDAEGFLYILDRKRDMVISGGVNIYPAEIEAALAEMPGVLDSAVFGIPDAEYGEAVCAYVQSAPGHAPQADAIAAFLRQRLAGFKVPKSIRIVDALPREESGKIMKRRLRDPYWERAGRQI